MSRWKPATMNGKPVEAGIQIVVPFSTPNNGIVQPSFRGKSVKSFSQYIANQLRRKMLMQTIKRNAGQKITVSFTIDESENITKGKIANSPDPEVTSAVLKILKESPRWMVPIQNGKPATMHLDLPIIICSVVQKKQSASGTTIRGHLILSFGI